MWGKTSKSGPEASSPQPIQPAEPQRTETAAPPVKAALSQASTRISAGILIEGEITGREDIHIEGEVRGQLRMTNAKIHVGAQGRVRADLEAREIEVQGRVEGDLRGHERVRIGASGKVHGNVLTQRIAIDEGAILQGSVDIVPPGSARRAEETKSVAAAPPNPQRVPEPVNELEASSDSVSPVEAS